MLSVMIYRGSPGIVTVAARMHDYTRTPSRSWDLGRVTLGLPEGTPASKALAAALRALLDVLEATRPED